MVLDATIRLEKLKELRSSGEPIALEKVYYKGQSQHFKVYKIDLNHLAYNRHNGRFGIDMATWRREHGVTSDDYNDEVHQAIESFLWDSNTARNRHTLDDLKNKGQLHPGIVTLDGVIVDGNRRAMLLRKAGIRHFEAVLLPDAYGANEQEIVRLETQYQLGEDEKLGYNPLEKYMRVKRLKDEMGFDDGDISGLMGITDGEVKKLYGIMGLMDAYLVHIGCPQFYNLLKDKDGTKEGMFVDLHNDLTRFAGDYSGAADWAPDGFDVDVLKTIQFDYVRYGNEFSGTEKTYRKISHNGAGKKSIFARKALWDAFQQDHKNNIDPMTKKFPSLTQFCKDHSDVTSRAEAAQQREARWQDAVKAQLKGNFGRAEAKLDSQVSADEPNRILLKALSALSQIDYSAKSFTDDDENLPLIKEINSISFAMKKAFEKASRA